MVERLYVVVVVIGYVSYECFVFVVRVSRYRPWIFPQPGSSPRLDPPRYICTPLSKKGSKSFPSTYSVPVASIEPLAPPWPVPRRRRSRSKPAETLAEAADEEVDETSPPATTLINEVSAWESTRARHGHEGRAEGDDARRTKRRASPHHQRNNRGEAVIEPVFPLITDQHGSIFFFLGLPRRFLFLLRCASMGLGAESLVG
jgi:hypothetical protein